MLARRRSVTALLAVFLTLPLASAAARRPAEATLEALREGQKLEGFTATALYVDEADRPLGARFVHDRSGFTLDYLRIQSVPQTFMWVNSWPTSDMGEPHTQEHLLLGKGNRGRAVADAESMTLTSSSAYTQQARTCYFFYTAAGAKIFYDQFERRLDALLHPDYTDEEIRREVRNFGISQNPTDGSLRLEEKGTVYNEMVSSFASPYYRVYKPLGDAVYGPHHPLSAVSGGAPEAIRNMTPEDIRRFHGANYHLGNMGAIASLPKELALGEVLRTIGAALDRVEPDAPARRGTFKTADADVPAPSPSPAGTIVMSSYPSDNPQTPSPMLFQWPANMKLEARDQLLLDLFMSAFAGDPTTNLYKLFVDTKTRVVDIGATSVFGYVDTNVGYPVTVGFPDVATAHLTEADVDAVRRRVLDELARVAAWKDGSPELAEFDARIGARILEQRRGLSKFVNSPPGFGFRNTSSAWMFHLDRLNREPGFRKSLTMKEDLAWVDGLVASKKNVWRDLIERNGLTTPPYGSATRPDPKVLEREAAERQERVAAELARLRNVYGTTDDQATIKRYAADVDAGTAELARLSKAGAPPRFVDTPPLSLDDALDFSVRTLAGGVPIVASTFDNMSSATTGVALRADVVQRDELMYLALLPTLLTQSGVIENGRPVSFEEMSERLRKEILSLDAYYATNPRTGRAELVLRGAGNTTAEAERAIAWMELVAFHPDWRVENVARLRDVVDQTLSGLHSTMRNSEEAWVNDPADAWWRQDSPVLLAVDSFLTREHNALRLRWQLKDAGADRDRVEATLSALAAASVNTPRGDLIAFASAIAAGAAPTAPTSLAPLGAQIEALPAGAKTVVREAAKDLALFAPDLPDGSFPNDWAALCTELRDDLHVGPAKALAALEDVRARILNAGGARTFMIGSSASQKALLGTPLPAFLAKLDPTPAKPIAYGSEPLVTARLRERIPGASPVFVGLLNPNTQGGVFLNSAPGATFSNVDRESLLRLLASEVYSGGGAHSMFMKTWGAGLAYSNGLRISVARGQVTYYAERCPELAQTLRFVIDELKRDQRDPQLVEYAVAMAFRGLRSAASYEVRGEAMANDIADGVTPEVVKTFFSSVLALRSSPTLATDIYDRMPAVYAQVLPGAPAKAVPAKGGLYFVIGPEKQMALYEAYLKSAQGPDATLYRLAPRDFWVK